MKNNAQMTAWFLTATIGPILCVLGGESWLAVLIVAAICSLLVWLTHRYGTKEMPKWLCVAELIWLTIFLGSIADKTGTFWAVEGDFILIPSVLLLIAAVATQRGAQQTMRTGATLMWLVLPVLGIVLLAGSAEGKLQYVQNGLEFSDGLLPVFFLIPCLRVFLPTQEGKLTKWLMPILSAVAVASTLILDATIGASLAKESENSFYEFSRGVNILGIAERFEALIACCLTGGWFTLFTMFLSAAYHLAQQVFPKLASRCLWVIAASAIGSMCILHIDHWLLVIGSLIFWVFLPILTQGIGYEKKDVKSLK